MKIKYVLYKTYSLSQVLCTVKARCVVKLALQDSYVVWFTEAYIENIFDKLIFKTFILKNSKKKVRIYCLDPEYVPVGSSSQHSLPSLEQIPCYIGFV